MEGRTGASYRTATQLQLRADHAAARDAVQAELDLIAAPRAGVSVALGNLRGIDGGAGRRRSICCVRSWGDDSTRRRAGRFASNARTDCEVQIAIGDGLSVKAVAAQVPALLPLLMAGAGERGWRTGRPFAIRHCRVGVMNEIGELLRPAAVVLLVGERPGLATAESLSAYLAYRPRAGDSDAQRNLVSNIHAKGWGRRRPRRGFCKLVEAMLRERTSGVHLKEELQAEPMTQLMLTQAG